MNLSKLTRVQDVQLSNVSKLVSLFLNKHRAAKNVTFPFNEEGMFGEIIKKDLDTSFTFYRVDNKEAKPPLTVSVTLPKGGTTQEIIQPVAEDVLTLLQKQQLKHPTKLEQLKEKLGEITLAGTANAVAQGVTSAVNAVNNLKVTRY